jgi:hypothetical protein
MLTPGHYSSEEQYRSKQDRLAEDTLARPSVFCEHPSASVEEALLKGLAVRAVERFQTVDQFRQALLNLSSEGDSKVDIGKYRKSLGWKGRVELIEVRGLMDFVSAESVKSTNGRYANVGKFHFRNRGDWDHE